MKAYAGPQYAAAVINSFSIPSEVTSPGVICRDGKSFRISDIAADEGGGKQDIYRFNGWTHRDTGSIAEVKPKDMYTVGSINSIMADTGSYCLYNDDGKSRGIVDSVIVKPRYVTPMTFREKILAVGGQLYSSFSTGRANGMENGKWVDIFQNANGLWPAGNLPNNIFRPGSYDYLYPHNGSVWTTLCVGANSSIGSLDAWSNENETSITGDSYRKTCIFHRY